MKTFLTGFLIALLIALVLTPLVKKVAHKLKWYDNREMDRKEHTGNVPRVGGLVIFVAFLLPMLGLYIYGNSVSLEFFADMTKMTGFFFLGAAAFALGFLDDLFQLSAKIRLAGQFLVGLGAYFFGFSFDSIGIVGIEFELPLLLSMLGSVLWFMLVINAINLIDGMDGLAGGIVFIVTASMFISGFYTGAVALTVAAAVLSGALLGFLHYNFRPQNIFMGDGGAYFLGFAIAALTLNASMKSTAAVVLLMPVLALGVPIFDTILSFMRRLWRGIPFSRADRGHIHHRLKKMGFNSRQAVMILYLLTATACFAAFWTTYDGDAAITMGLCAYTIALVLGVELAGFNGVISTFTHVASKYIARKRRYNAVSRLQGDEALSFDRATEHCLKACRALECSHFSLELDRFGQRMFFRVNGSAVPAAQCRKLILPLSADGIELGEIHFAIHEDKGEVFIRDYDYFETMAKGLSRSLALEATDHPYYVLAMELSANDDTRKSDAKPRQPKPEPAVA
ncbi:MAG: MraY family glycosyltransferase [Planctomycetota bacterium]|nr:MraY family glycosyltransferase [Planctomycetota bacterium]